MPNTQLEATRLLVVDPRPDDYLQLANTLDVGEKDLQFAISGDEALRLTNLSALNLWLINFRLPDMTGPELLRLVRSRTPQAACVLVSDLYSSADEVTARQLGATLYACKPLQPDWLRALPLMRKQRSRTHPPHGPPRASPAPDSADNLASRAIHHPHS